MQTNPHQFRAFAQVVQAGGFSAAARRLGVTQSAVTQHVTKLEQRVGSKLLMRGANGIELTAAGRDLFDLAERFLTLTQEIDERIAGYANFETGQLSVIANAPQPALATIAQYTKRFPKVEINFTLFDWTQTMRMLADHSVDVAFVTSPRMLPGCVFEKVSETSYVLYVAADHPLAGREDISLDELEVETLLLPEYGSLTQRVVTEALGARGKQPRRRVNTTTFPVMKEAILHGIGVGIFLANASAPNDGLVTLPIREMPERYEIFAAAPRHKMGLGLIQSFWDELGSPA